MKQFQKHSDEIFLWKKFWNKESKIVNTGNLLTWNIKHQTQKYCIITQNVKFFFVNKKIGWNAKDRIQQDRGKQRREKERKELNLMCAPILPTFVVFLVIIVAITVVFQ